MEKGKFKVKVGLAEMLKGGVIMDVTNPEQAQIAENAGANGAVIAEHVKNKPLNDGHNAASGEYVDMLDAGIVDPAKVTRSGLQNAASIAGMVLTTECIVADLPEKKDASPAGAGRRFLDPGYGREHRAAHCGRTTWRPSL